MRSRSPTSPAVEGAATGDGASSASRAPPAMARSGELEELYSMPASSNHHHATGICTKFIVRKANRGGPVAFA
ncbi:MAG: hypothetical protein U0Q12_18915 [Vicinamibacterales bacterium]